MEYGFPFRFQMAILLVDDDEDVVDANALAFSESLPKHTIYKVTSAQAAIKFLKSHALRFTSGPGEFDFSSFASQGEVVFNTENLSNLDVLADYSKDVGIIVIDYDMPEMDGLKLAKEIAEYSLSIILLTGKFTSDDATGAFNLGLIDRYMPKDQRKPVETLTGYIRELEKIRFNEFNSQFLQFWGVDHFSFLKKPNVQKALNELCISLDVERIAPSFDPPGLLVESANRKRHLVVIADHDAIESKIEIARGDGATENVIDAMVRRTGLYLPELKDSRSDDLADPVEYPYLCKLSPLSADTYYVVLGLLSI